MSLLGDVTSPTTAVHYDSMTCSEHREALTGAPTEHGVHKHEFTVQGEVHSSPLNSREATLRHSSGWGLEAFPHSIVICTPVVCNKLFTYMLCTTKVVIIKMRLFAI